MKKDRIKDIIFRRDERDNEKEKGMKERELNKEMKRIEKEKELEENKNKKKRDYSININENDINAKKVITDIEELKLASDGNIEMENISQNKDNDNTSESI